MDTNFKHEVLKKCVALICQSIGFQGMYSVPLDVLTDLLHRYLREIAVTVHNFSEHDNRTNPTLSDLQYAFNEMKISLPELEEYYNSVDSLPFPDKLPALPVHRPSELNLLKPGSKEIISRPLYIHEHLPPMIADQEEEDSKDGNSNGNEEDGSGAQQSSEPSSPAPTTNDAFGSTLNLPTPSQGNEGEPVREIDSVMMTTSGYISSAREGKLAEPRLPHIPLPQLPTHTPARALSVSRNSNNNNGSNSAANQAALAAAAANKKKASLDKLMRYKQNLAQKKASNANKKMLSHSAVLNAAGKSQDAANSSFVTKHGKSKDKIKPKIPATPPGTSSTLGSSFLRTPNQPPMNRPPNVLKNTPSTTKSPPFFPPKLKIPAPKIECEYATDVLPLPKEHLQEQEERKLQILRKEEKQKELMAAAASGLLGPMGPQGIMPDLAAIKAKKEKDKKEKKINKEKISKDPKKDKADKSKKDSKKDKQLRKDDKIKKKRKEERRKEKDIKKQKSMMKQKGEEPGTIGLGLEMGKELKDKSAIKKDKKEGKKVKKMDGKHIVSPTKNTSLPPHPIFSQPPALDQQITSQHLPNPESSINIPELDKSKLCIFKKNSNKNSANSSFDHTLKFPDHSATLEAAHSSNAPHSEMPFSSPPAEDRSSKKRNRIAAISEFESPPPKRNKLMMSDIHNSSDDLSLSVLSDQRPPTPGGYTSDLPRTDLSVKQPPLLLSHNAGNPNFFPPFSPSLSEYPMGSDSERPLTPLMRPPTPGGSDGGPHKSPLFMSSQYFRPSAPQLKNRMSPTPFEPSPIIPSPLGDSAVPVAESDKKKKEKEHKKEKKEKTKDKDKIKKKKDKKEKVKLGEKKISKEKSKKDKTRDKELKKDKLLLSAEDVRPTEPVTPKLVIKRTEPSERSAEFQLSTSIPPLDQNTHKVDRPGSPELAKISALFTRPPKSSRPPKEKEQQPSSSVASLPALKIKEIKNKESVEEPKGFTVTSDTSSGIKKITILPPEKPKKPEVENKVTSTASSSSATGSSSASSLMNPIGHFVDEHGNEVWICPTCGKQDDGSPMIGCDTCDDWYHWVCVGIQVPPNEAENWYCPRCLEQHKQRSFAGISSKKDKKKHQNRRRNKGLH